MKNIILAALIGLLCSGCGQGWGSGLSRAEVIAAIGECDQAGLGHQILTNGITHNPWKVNCVDKD